jgi:hypothetical protein
MKGETMRFQLSISMDNDAFREDTGPETARIMRALAERVEHSTLTAGDSGTVRDTNGNTVGQWSVSGE